MGVSQFWRSQFAGSATPSDSIGSAWLNNDDVLVIVVAQDAGGDPLQATQLDIVWGAGSQTVFPTDALGYITTFTYRATPAGAFGGVYTWTFPDVVDFGQSEACIATGARDGLPSGGTITGPSGWHPTPSPGTFKSADWIVPLTGAHTHVSMWGAALLDSTMNPYPPAGYTSLDPAGEAALFYGSGTELSEASGTPPDGIGGWAWAGGSGRWKWKG